MAALEAGRLSGAGRPGVPLAGVSTGGSDVPQ